MNNVSKFLDNFCATHKKIIRIFLASKILVLIISLYVAWLVAGSNHTPNWHEWLLIWNRWDTVHYIDIAQHGYPASGKLLGFFPLFPGLIYLFNFIFHNTIISGLVISLMASYLSLFYFYKLLDIEGIDKKVINRTLILFIIFPSAIFLSAIYTESLFIVLILATFYYFRQNNWLASFFLLSLATLTRSTGILLWPIFLWYFLQNKPKFNIKNAILMLLPSLALGLFVLLEKSVSGDWLAYSHSQVEFWYRPYTNFWTTFAHTFNQVHFSELGKFWLQQIIYALFSLLIIIYSFFAKKFPRIYSWYMLLNWLTFTSWNYLASLPRYVLILFPMFWLAAALVNNKIIYYFVVIFLVLAMSINSVDFLLGRLFY